MMKELKHFFYLLAALVCICVAVNYLFGEGKKNKEKEAIELVRQTKIELSGWAELMGKTSMTWGEYANKQIADNPTEKYSWRSYLVESDETYRVSFVDEEGWGQNWEVDIRNKIVRDINSSAYLSWKYGFSRCDRSGMFQVCDVTLDTLKYKNQKLTYQLKGSILNNSGKNITSVSFSDSNVEIIFQEKEIRNKAVFWDCNSTAVSKRSPWRNNTKINFSVLIKDIEAVYLDYDPEVVLFKLELNAEDPIGFEYDKGIYETDLSEQWKKNQQQTR